jgi:sec-independent protein translocase protein TatA
MPSWLGAPELLIILIIVILIFGVGRIANIGGELGKGISAFRKGLKSDEDVEKKPDEEVKKE